MTTSRITLDTLLVIVSCLCYSIGGYGQQTATKKLTISGYAEVYYSIDLLNNKESQRPAFLYSHNRNNEVSLNLGYIKAMYSDNKVRSNMALMSGTYAQANLSDEPGTLKNIFEANAGVKISSSKNIWIDAGIFPSHIGFESAVGKDCWSAGRSILADNSPYYESGIRLSFTSQNEKWYVAGLVLNGWQRIQRLPGNSMPAFGHQVTFKPNSTLTLNSSSFIGSDTPDSLRQIRYFHNFYSQYQLGNKWGMIIGLDVGAQQKDKNASSYNLWYAPILNTQFRYNEHVSAALRAEYYSDTQQVIISTGTTHGFQTFGYSANIDYHITDFAIWRVEFRGFSSKDPIFEQQGKLSQQNFSLLSSLAVAF